MLSGITIRQAIHNDVEAISRLIIATVQQSNAKDYSAAIIAEVAEKFSPDHVAARMTGRHVFIAGAESMMIGTASLDGAKVRSVFVLPAWQGRGIGRILMSHIEELARAQGVPRLEVPASITAEDFYVRLGYNHLREEYYVAERIIVMEKTI